MTQNARGNQIVQIQHAAGSTIEITFAGLTPQKVPLRPAEVVLTRNVDSPARLLRARSRVVPFLDDSGLLGNLDDWRGTPDPFASHIIGGRGGSGKTRLAVELCKRAESDHWLAGLLEVPMDASRLETLVGAPVPRLVVVDYAESLVEQLAVVLPALAAAASAESPVRVLLLIRSAPRVGVDWTGILRHRDDALDALLDETETASLEATFPTVDERQRLYDATVRELADRAGLPTPAPVEELGGDLYRTPLAVAVRAYLAVHEGSLETSETGSASRETIEELFDELLAHEHRYWTASDRAARLDADPVLRQRIVALATLAGASDERSASELLVLLDDLRQVSSERRARIARWAHDLYPGVDWWNPLEPDRIGEHLVARTFASTYCTHPVVSASDMPEVIRAVLQTDDPSRLRRPLDLYARRADDQRHLATHIATALASELPRLCRVATVEVLGNERALFRLGRGTVAELLARIVDSVTIDPVAGSASLEYLPQQPHPILGPLTLRLVSQTASFWERFGSAEHDEHLAAMLNMQALPLAHAGRHAEALDAIQGAVAAYRRVAAADPNWDPTDLAVPLRNLSNQLATVGDSAASLAAAAEAVGLYREAALRDADACADDLSLALNILSNRLGETGRHVEALAAIGEAVTLIEGRATVDNPKAEAAPRSRARQPGAAVANRGAPRRGCEGQCCGSR